MIPARLITTWIHDHRNPYTDAHRDLFQRCLASWERLMPEWEITIITAETLFMLGDDPWVRDRMAEGNFIGASAWARTFWLQQLGGVYVDMDVEAIQSFETLATDPYFIGRQKDGFVNPAIMGCVAGHPFLAKQLATMKTCDPKNPQFGNESGPRMVTRLLKARPHPDVIVYPPEVFYPYHWNEPYDDRCLTPKTIAVHHWASTWWPPKPAMVTR